MTGLTYRRKSLFWAQCSRGIKVHHCGEAWEQEEAWQQEAWKQEQEAEGSLCEPQSPSREHSGS